jgi:hypothetical protein
MCWCTPMRSTLRYCPMVSASRSASSMGMPNLLAPWPVETCSWVSASTSGLTRSATRARLPWRPARRSRVSSSEADSTLKSRMRSPRPAISSSSVLPTPAKTTFLGSKPARIARYSSPPETMSAPAPKEANARITARFPFAFAAKQTRWSKAGESLVKFPVRFFQGGVAVDVGRGSGALRDLVEGDAFAPEAALPVGERVVQGVPPSLA